MDFWIGYITGSAATVLATFLSGIIDDEEDFIRKWSSTPYCITETILDNTYKRCWKVLEITPQETLPEKKV